jgi:hypothetical protein
MSGRSDTAWRKIGTVSTGNCMLTIVPPYYAETLAEHWAERLRSDDRLSHASYEEIELHQRTLNFRLADFADSERCLLFDTPGNGAWDVEGRFDDIYDDGHPLLVEVRIRLFENGQDE